MSKNNYNKLRGYLLTQRIIIYLVLFEWLKRLTQKTYTDSTTESFTYDSKGNVITASNQNITYTFTYDAAGKVTNVTDYYGKTIKYEYDTAGNKVKMTTPEGKEIKYTYDVSHRLTQRGKATTKKNRTQITQI